MSPQYVVTIAVVLVLQGAGVYSATITHPDRVTTIHVDHGVNALPPQPVGPPTVVVQSNGVSHPSQVEETYFPNPGIHSEILPQPNLNLLPNTQAYWSPGDIQVKLNVNTGEKLKKLADFLINLQ